MSPPTAVVDAAAAPSARDREYAVLHAHTDADQAVARYERVLTDALTGQPNWGPWHRKNSPGPVTSSRTSEFPTTKRDNATRATLPLRNTPALCPRSAAGDLVADRRRHYALAQFGGGRNAVLSPLAGCHLTPGPHRRGTPAPVTAPPGWSTR
ncbi:hypothetical protein M8542_36395 [Amycolatopsis sp. OK19-0408]|uniref:Uncharacterized protein n=1 Tax=Amycolatopsis iheyensis TaxID=2945988 RepID=A0A9X2NNJ9_9PSEU|nr:hypothetical protein [Amycolatopsis iheyensis]MCR6488325.1 hypothetical protein [Amycolatopsis iheyensis]